MPEIRVRTLGTFQVTHSGRLIAFASLKQRALIAYLSVNKPKAYRREYLADLLWQDVDETRGRHSLTQALYAIRRIVPGLLSIDKQVVSAHATTDIDEIREAFARDDLMAMAALLAGPFLDDLVIKGAPEFEEWRDNLSRSLFHQWDNVVTARLVSEPRRQQERILGLLPFPSLPLLPNVSALLGGTVAQSIVPRRHLVAASTTANAPSDPALMPWVGRYSQLETMSELFYRALSGDPQFALVEGAAGFGKTRLVNEFLARISTQEQIVLKTTCYEAERGIPFGPITDVLGRSMSQQLLSGLEPIWLGTLKHLMPHIEDQAESPPALSASASQSRLFEAVLRLLQHVGKSRPVILLIDDLQWCDRSTYALLSYLYHRVHDSPLFVLGARRTSDARARGRELWPEWKRIAVHEFNQEEMSDLIDRLFQRNNVEFPPPDRLAKLTAGHPYLVSEYLRSIALRAGATSGAERTESLASLEDFIDSLLDDLPVSSQRLVAVLAVLRRPARIDLIRSVAQKRSIEQALELLASRGIIEIIQNRVRFRHDLVREAAYGRIPALTRIDIHKRAADIIIKDNESYGESAGHYYHARLRTLAYKYALKAAKDSDARSATPESVHYLKLALKARPDRALIIRPLLAERLSQTHRLAAARGVLAPALADSRLPRRSSLRLRLLDLEMAYALGHLNGVELRQQLARLRLQLGPKDVSLIHRATRLQLRSAVNDGDKSIISSSVAQLRQFSDGRLRTNDDIASLCLAVKVESLIHSSRVAAEWAQPLISKCNDITTHELRIHVLGILGGVFYDCGEIGKAEAIHRRALMEIQEVGAISMWPVIALHTHMLLVEQGKYDKAFAVAEEFELRSSVMDATEKRAVMCANNAMMLYDLGRLAEAKQCVTRGLQFCSHYSSVWLKIALSGVAGLVAVEEGNITYASEMAESARIQIDSLGIRILDLSAVETLIARVDCIRNRQTAAVSRLEAAIADYSERDMVCRLKLKLELARVIRATDRKRARSEATAVFAAARAISALPLAERADSLLHRI